MKKQTNAARMKWLEEQAKPNLFGNQAVLTLLFIYPPHDTLAESIDWHMALEEHRAKTSSK